MKSIEILALGLDELSPKEMSSFNGGSLTVVIITFIALIALAVLVEVIPEGVELVPYQDNWGMVPFPGMED